MKKLKKVVCLLLCFTTICCTQFISATVKALNQSLDLDNTRLAEIYDESNYEHDFVCGEVIVGLNSAVSLSETANEIFLPSTENYSTGDTFSDDMLLNITNELLPDVGISAVENLLSPCSMNAFSLNDRSSMASVSNDTLLLITLESNTRQGVLDAIGVLKNNPNVSYAEPNYIVELDDSSLVEWIPNDDTYFDMTGIYNIEAPDAWEYETGDHLIKVGVFDTGIDYNHVDLAENIDIELGYNAITDEYVNLEDDVLSNDEKIVDDVIGHGTHVSGIIDAIGNNNVGVAGVVWDTAIVPIKIGNDSNGNATNDAILRGLNYAIELDLPVINISYNTFCKGIVSQSIENKINEYKGLVCAAAEI